jgi:hypothetical protein
MSNFNFIDFYIGYPGHPRYQSSELIEDDLLRVIVQKYEVIIFTNKGDVLGQPDLGANLLELLYETRYDGPTIEENIRGQIQQYIPELNGVDYLLTVEFFEDPGRFQEYMVINFQISDLVVDVTIT